MGFKSTVRSLMSHQRPYASPEMGESQQIQRLDDPSPSDKRPHGHGPRSRPRPATSPDRRRVMRGSEVLRLNGIGFELRCGVSHNHSSPHEPPPKPSRVVSRKCRQAHVHFRLKYRTPPVSFVFLSTCTTTCPILKSILTPPYTPIDHIPSATMGSTSANGILGDLPYLDIAYDLSNSETTARELAYRIQPKWRKTPDQIRIVQFKEGITNTVSQLPLTVHVPLTDGP